MGRVGDTGKGIEIMNGILAEGGHWRVRGWTKMASTEEEQELVISWIWMYHAT